MIGTTEGTGTSPARPGLLQRWRSAMQTVPFLLSLLMTGSVGACVGTETGNPSFTGELSYNTYTSDAAVVALRAPAGGITVESAWLVLGDVSFVPDGRCGGEVPESVHATGLGVGDHASPVAPSTPLMVPSGDYCGARLPFERAEAGELRGAPPALLGHSILIDATLADGTPVRILSAFAGTIEITSASDPFPLRPGIADLLVGFDVAAWLEDIGLQDAQRTGDAIEVSLRSNPGVLAAFEARLATGIGLFNDPTGTGQVTGTATVIAGGGPLAE